nr:hypothetical protein [Tanacetum cinerariifolium]
MDYCCSEGSLRDKIICDLNKTPDLSQQPSQNCPKCGNPVDDSSEPSNDNTNVINALQEPFVGKQDPGKNFSQSPPQIIHHCCYGYGDPLEDIFCHRCTCELYGKGAHYGYNFLPKVLVVSNPKSFNNQTVDELPQTLPSFDPTCYSEYGNLFTYDSKSNLVRDSPSSFYDEDVPNEIYSNPLFDEEIIYMKIDLHHFNAESDFIESLLNHDSPVISSSSKIDSFFDEFAGELTLLKSISPGINETDCNPEEEIRLIKRLLYDNSSPLPSEEFISKNSDAAFESFSPFPIPVEDIDSLMEEIDLSFTSDDPMPSDIEEDDYDSKRDILILGELLSNDFLSLPENESFHFDIPSSSHPPAKPPDGNTGILNIKVMGDISEYKVTMSRLMLTQPTLVPN